MTGPTAGPQTGPTPVTVRMLLDGQWVDGGGPEAADINPARPAEQVARLRLADPGQVEAAVAAARRAAPGWADTPFHARGAILARAGDLLAERAEDIGRELTREEGKTLPEGVAEVRRAADILRFHAAEANQETGQVYASPRLGERILVVHRPVGVVACVTPWNFPIAIPAWKIAPALAYGNTVVWKPASLVPLLAYRLAQALVDAGLPPGVLSLVFGGGAVGQALVEHPDVDVVTFTGSTEVGRALIAACGRLARPIQTEMGGKNAAVVLPDADFDVAAEQVLAGAMRSTGQKCTATSRLVVHEAIHDRFVEALCDRVAALRVGDGLTPGIDIGPVASANARSDVLGHVRRAREQGGTVLVGGEPYTAGDLAEGFFVPPTVVHLPDRTADLWREEVFGPVLAVVRAGSPAEALALANDSRFGLSAAVFTNDLRTITDAIDHLDVGVLHVNSESAGADPHVPFGGVKDSGGGPKEQGKAAREFFTRTKTVYLRPLG